MRSPARLSLAAAVAALGATVLAPAAQAAGTGLVRTDQVGYLPGEVKIAYLMTTAAVSGETYRVLGADGTTAAEGKVGASRGSWNAAYPDVYPIDFSAVTTAGAYHVVTSGPVSAASGVFRIEDAGALYGTMVDYGTQFFQAQRDGRNVVPGQLGRKPSHLNDATATVYKTPTFDDNEGGSPLVKLGGPVDVEGGWFDAGDYLKFTFTAAYADSILYASAQALGANAPAALRAEARFGADWLDKMYDAGKKTLYLQVGIGSGAKYVGDHDIWRLPQADDHDTKHPAAGAHRPVFEAAAPGAKIDPDIVGRVAAAFAFAAQADAATDPARAEAELNNATSLYAQANLTPSGHLASVLPTEFYSESIWHDAMELGATEIARAQQTLGKPGPASLPYLTQAATWASDYLHGDAGKDTFNLYDTSALAHADLISALHRAGDPSGLAVTPADLVADLKAQVASFATPAASDIFHEGGDYANFDVDSHTFGSIATEAMYEKVSGDTEYAGFAAQQRSWLLGGNPWGTSMMVGEGTTFPHCLASQIPNLQGSLTGAPPIQIGAVVNGPNNQKQFKDLVTVAGMKTCKNDSPFTSFTGHGAEYIDDMRSWQSSEPALDMTGAAVIAAAYQQSLARTR